MDVLVTGAAGFIGSHLVESMLSDDYRVVGLDNFDPYYERSAKERNLLAALEHPDFTFVEADICDGERLADVLADTGPFDAIVHLAAKAGVRPSIADPLGYERTNVAGTLNLLELAARAQRQPRFVFASSSSVYGNNPKTPFSETDSVDHPISPYAATKKTGELICHTYHHLYGLSVFCLRFFTVFGPRQRPDLAIHKFAKRIMAGEPIQMFGDGTTSRDYTYIDDIVTGVRSAVDRCQGYEIVNLGGEHPVTLTKMIETIAQTCDQAARIEQMPMQPGDVETTYADIAKARRLLAYNPSTTFGQGVQRQVQWLKEQA